MVNEMILILDIINISFLDGDVPYVIFYGVYFSQLKPVARVCVLVFTVYHHRTPDIAISESRELTQCTKRSVVFPFLSMNYLILHCKHLSLSLSLH